MTPLSSRIIASLINQFPDQTFVPIDEMTIEVDGKNLSLVETEHCNAINNVEIIYLHPSQQELIAQDVVDQVQAFLASPTPAPATENPPPAPPVSPPSSDPEKTETSDSEKTETADLDKTQD